MRIQKQWLIDKVMATPKFKLALRNQVQRQFIEQAMELKRGQHRGLRLPRATPHQACNPFQPRRVVYL